MSNRRSQGKLETKIARNYCYENSEWKHRNNNPNEINEKTFTKTAADVEKAVLTQIQGKRTGTIPNYPQGLVIADQRQTGFFNVIKIDDEVILTDFHI